MNGQPLVSIVIPTHNRKSMVLRLLKSVFASRYKNIEVIVIDDASNDNTFKTLKKKFGKNKRMTIVRNKVNLFTAGSRNVGFKKSQGEYVFFIDDDNILDKIAISSLVGLFLKDPTVGELGPVNYSYSNKQKILWARTKRNMFTSKTNQSRSLKEFGNLKNWETDDIPNAFMVKSSLAKKHKIFFTDKYGIMYEESDYAYKIRSVGYKIKVVRDAKIYHDVEQIVKGGKKKDYMFHFMEDERRPFVFARNRIIFHSVYSNKFQFLLIAFIWVWLFTIYYAYKIFFYSGAGSFSFSRRVLLVLAYLRGTFYGLFLAFSRKSLYGHKRV